MIIDTSQGCTQHSKIENAEKYEAFKGVGDELSRNVESSPLGGDTGPRW